MMSIFTPGTRTYILSVVALGCALLLQAHIQGVLVLPPMLEVSLYFVLTVVLPLVPVAIRKAITNMELRLEKRLQGGR